MTLVLVLGFSITQWSERGCGLDVVAVAVEGLTLDTSLIPTTPALRL